MTDLGVKKDKFI